MEGKDTITKWIENALEYFKELSLRTDSDFSFSYDTDSHSGYSFHQNLKCGSKGFYKWCAVSFSKQLVFYYRLDSLLHSYFDSKYQTDPPAFAFNISDIESPILSGKDKNKLKYMYEEMCVKIRGMNEQIHKTLMQCEKEFDITIDTETMFKDMPSVEHKEEQEDNELSQ